MKGNDMAVKEHHWQWARRLYEIYADACIEAGGRRHYMELRMFDGWANDPEEEDSPVIAGNWNDIHAPYVQGEPSKVLNDEPSRLCAVFERMGFEIEWCDQVTDCSGCYRAIRTEPTHYGWQPDFVHGECEILCIECIKADPTDLMEEKEGNHQTAWNLPDIDPADHGYWRAGDNYESGWHPGQADHPEEIAKILKAIKVDRFLFVIDSVGQFDVHFSVYVHESEFEYVSKEAIAYALMMEPTKRFPSPGEIMSEQLKAVPKVPPQADGSVPVTKIGGEDGPTTRLISPQEFIDGKALDPDAGKPLD